MENDKAFILFEVKMCPGLQNETIGIEYFDKLVKFQTCNFHCYWSVFVFFKQAELFTKLIR